MESCAVFEFNDGAMSVPRAPDVQGPRVRGLVWNIRYASGSVHVGGLLLKLSTMAQMGDLLWLFASHSAIYMYMVIPSVYEALRARARKPAKAKLTIFRFRLVPYIRHGRIGASDATVPKRACCAIQDIRTANGAWKNYCEEPTAWSSSSAEVIQVGRAQAQRIEVVQALVQCDRKSDGAEKCQARATRMIDGQNRRWQMHMQAWRKYTPRAWEAIDKFLKCGEMYWPDQLALATESCSLAVSHVFLLQSSCHPARAERYKM